VCNGKRRDKEKDEERWSEAEVGKDTEKELLYYAIMRERERERGCDISDPHFLIE
jgi:hypothetical protein